MTERPHSVRRRMAHGAGWMLLQRLAVRCIGLVSTIVLARLLVPGDFGIVALATGFQGVIESFAELGFDLALIQRQTSERAAYDTTWTLCVIRGVLIAVALLALADMVAGYYGDPRLAPLMRWLALGAVIAGLQNVGMVEFQRDLRFDVEFRLMVWSKIGAFVVTILLAVWRRDYWALIAGIIVAKLVSLVMSYVLHSYRPRLSLAGAGNFLHFATWLSLNNIMSGIKGRLDTFVIGKLAGASLLGIYSVGYEISNLVASELMWPVSRVVFSGFARMAAHRGDLAKGFLDLLGMLFLVGTPAAVGIGLTSEYLVRIFLGSQWLAAIPLIQILAIFGVLNFATAASQSIFLALGKPQLMAAANLPAFLLLPPLLIWGIAQYGLAGAAWALVADGSINLVVNIALMRRQIDFTTREIGAVMLRPAIATIAMVAAVAPALMHWPIAETMADLVSQVTAVVALGALTYAGVVMILWRLAGLPSGAEANALAGFRMAWNEARHSRIVEKGF
jgi:lipopolysaccharide exporter